MHSILLVLMDCFGFDIRVEVRLEVELPYPNRPGTYYIGP